jgi:ATP-dependent RNA helicase HrpB
MAIEPLPIDALRDDLERAAAPADATLVIEAAPGAGKTTRVPAALEAMGQRVVVLEPRRLAARLAAERVASERGERVGQSVGHQVRFDSSIGPDTRLRFVTEGVLTRMILDDPELSAFDTVVVDEIHERHLQGDLALALLGHLRRRRDLRLVAMSATLDAEHLVAHLGAKLLRCQVRRFEVAVEHLAQPDRDPLDVQVAKAVRRLVREGLDGHVLVFLPGAREIDRARERCRAVARDADLTIFPLHGSLAPREQDAAVAKSERYKLILSTNVAESSLTIPGVAAVVDSGLAKRARHAAWSTMSRLELGPISQASATQRAGRAGRERPGRCLRLYTEQEHRRWRAADEPEILRSDLSEVTLASHVVGQKDPRALPWLDPPSAAAWEAAERLLGTLGALRDGTLTDVGRAMARLPLAPRLGRALLEAARRGVLESLATALAIVAEGSCGKRGAVALWPQVEALDALRGARFDADLAARLGIDARRARAAERTRKQLLSPRVRRQLRGEAVPVEDLDRAAAQSLLAGFVDRVGKRTAGGGIALFDGTKARLSDPEAVGPEGLCLALAARGGDAKTPATVDLAIGLRVDDVFEICGDAVRDEEELVFDDARGRVDSIARLRYGALVLEESRGPARGSAATEVLVDAVFRLGLARVGGRDAEHWLLRLAQAARANADLKRARDELRTRLTPMFDGMTRLVEIEQAGLVHLLGAALEPGERRSLDALAPASLTLGSRRLSIHYPADAPPWVEGYLQDFFGVASLPRIGQTPLVVRLWAPNRRPVQVTDDLGGFWQTLYPTLVRQLSRRYPKHHWPDDPASARPVLLKRQL